MKGWLERRWEEIVRELRREQRNQPSYHTMDFRRSLLWRVVLISSQHWGEMLLCDRLMLCRVLFSTRTSSKRVAPASLRPVLSKSRVWMDLFRLKPPCNFSIPSSPTPQNSKERDRRDVVVLNASPMISRPAGVKRFALRSSSSIVGQWRISVASESELASVSWQSPRWRTDSGAMRGKQRKRQANNQCFLPISQYTILWIQISGS